MKKGESKIKTLIIVPAYNEEESIKKVVEEIKSVNKDVDVIVVNDGSKDNTLKEVLKTDAIAIDLPCNLGIGGAVQTGYLYAYKNDYDVAIQIDGDGQHNPKYIKDMVKIIESGKADMVIGDRLSSTYFTENKRPFHNFGNSMVRKAINTLFKSDIKDIMTGLRAFSYRFVKTFPVISKGFEIETEMTIHAIDKNMLVANYVIDYRDRIDGSESKLNTYSDGLKVIKTIVKLYKDYKPRHFFSWIGTVLFILSVVFFIPVFITYMKTGQVPNFPTLIVCGFTMITAIQCYIAGMILSTIVAKDKQDFEFKLVMIDRMEKELKRKDR